MSRFAPPPPPPALFSEANATLEDLQPATKVDIQAILKNNTLPGWCVQRLAAHTRFHTDRNKHRDQA